MDKFLPADPLEIDDGYAVAYVANDKRLIGLADVNSPSGFTLVFAIDEAKRLRDWLSRVIPSPAPETNAVPEAPEKTWECGICGLNNYSTMTHCGQCDYSRMVTREGRLVPRDPR